MKESRSARFLFTMLAITAALPHVIRARADNRADSEAAKFAASNREPIKAKPSKHGADRKLTEYLPSVANLLQHGYEADANRYASEEAEFNVATLEYPKQPLYKTMFDQFGSVLRAIMKLPGNIMKAVSVVINGHEHADREEDADSDDGDSGERS